MGIVSSHSTCQHVSSPRWKIIQVVIVTQTSSTTIGRHHTYPTRTLPDNASITYTHQTPKYINPTIYPPPFLHFCEPICEKPDSVREMAQAMASMAGLRASSQAVLEGSLSLSGSTRLNQPANCRVGFNRPAGFAIRAQQVVPESETSRRAVLGLVAAGLASSSFVQAVLADARSIKIGPPPPPSGGLRECFLLLAFLG